MYQDLQCHQTRRILAKSKMFETQMNLKPNKRLYKLEFTKSTVWPQLKSIKNLQKCKRLLGILS